MTANFRYRLDARTGPGDDARPVIVGFAFLVAERGDSLCSCDLMRQHITERSKFADLKLANAHRLDFRVVSRGHIDLHLAANLVRQGLANVIVDRNKLGRRIVRLDPEADHAAIWTIRCVGGHGGWSS